jgi:hypothetical protein
MRKKDAGDINITINVRESDLVSLGKSQAVTVTITNPTANDVVCSSFDATGTVSPPSATLSATVYVKTNPSQQYAGTVVQAGSPWTIRFENLPIGPPLAMNVTAIYQGHMGGCGVDPFTAKQC